MKSRITFLRLFGRFGLALLLFGAPLLLAVSCPAQSTEDVAFAKLQADAKKLFRERFTPFVATYCKDCHGDKKRKGGINFQLALRNPGDANLGKQWLQALVDVREHDMPPEESRKQPTDAERAMFIDCIEKMKFLSPKDPGPFVMRRLTKVEYGNTLRDLLGVDPAIARDLPDEVSGEGYLNTMSSLQSEQYLEIANEALDRVMPRKEATSNKLQKQLFGEVPKPGADLRAAARKAAQAVAKKAYRRPASDEEVEVLLKVFDLGQKNKLSYVASLRLMLKAVLVSPEFLFITPAKQIEPSKEIVPLDDYQLASRLSYLLWETMPDAELLGLADSGKLHEPAILKAQVKRMLMDQRSRALFDGFGAQWLGLGALGTKTFDTVKFPLMTREMRAAMYDEARLFFESIVRENQSVMSFVSSDYTFLNGTLATLYGLEKTVTGNTMQKVKLTNANRGGILGMPGILATTSFPNRTSPVKRGVWVLEQVLGEHVPPPPPNVPPLEKQDQKKVASMTLRQRTELHRTNVVCASCHKVLDPIGFGLENFDAIGRWRDHDDSGGAIDAAGELPGGKHFTTPKELKVIISARKDDLARNLTEKLLAYALCRQLEGYDKIVVDHLMETIAKDGYRMQTLIAEIVTSYPFMNRRVRDSVAAVAPAK